MDRVHETRSAYYTIQPPFIHHCRKERSALHVSIMEDGRQQSDAHTSIIKSIHQSRRLQGMHSICRRAVETHVLSNTGADHVSRSMHPINDHPRTRRPQNHDQC